jgi:hypothetical protein
MAYPVVCTVRTACRRSRKIRSTVENSCLPMPPRWQRGATHNSAMSFPSIPTSPTIPAPDSAIYVSPSAVVFRIFGTAFCEETLQLGAGKALSLSQKPIARRYKLTHRRYIFSGHRSDGDIHSLWPTPPPTGGGTPYCSVGCWPSIWFILFAPRLLGACPYRGNHLQHTLPVPF